MSCKVILAGTIAKSLLAEVNDGLATLNGRKPHLCGILGNRDPAARVYADFTARTAKENGFRYSLIETDKDQVEEAIISANDNDDIDGIIVYYPVHNNRPDLDQYLHNCVSVFKDVEGLCHKYVFNMYNNIRYLDETSGSRFKSIIPCTPLAVIKILEYLHIYNTILPYGNRLFGHTICVVNRSEVVGRPLAALLANDGALVYSIDLTGTQIYTRGDGLRQKKHDVESSSLTLQDVAPRCDVVITGVPGDSFKFDTDLLRAGCVCLNISSEKNFPPEVKQKASIFVPAIGKVTIAVLLRNLTRLAAQNRHRKAVSAAPGNVDLTNGTMSANKLDEILDP